uniref:Anaphase-promoting complex subunit 5 n=1 Tax=Kalmanozyma brasiliensis (strain GHG001) TaxID=1365824 RepID=V5EW56_KALBG
MDIAVAQPDEINGETIAILILFNFHCRIQLSDEAQVARKKLLLFLMDKVYQTRSPSHSYAAFINELQRTMDGHEENGRIMTDYLDGMLHLLDVPDGLTKLFNEKLNRIMPSYEPMGVLNASDIFFERRSFFGLFFRRTKLIFDSLDLQAKDHLTLAARAWKQAPADLGPASLGELHSSDARLGAFRNYQLGLLRGDYVMTKDNMEKFFDFYAPGADRELHQHTLLHLAAFHVNTQSYSAAKAALDEAISLARSANDSDCISACESLMLRIQGVGTSTLAAVPAAAIVDRHRESVSDAVWQARCSLAKGRSAVEVLQDLEESSSPSQPSRDTLAASEASLELMEDAKRRLGRDALQSDVEVAQLWRTLGQSALADVYRKRVDLRKGGRSMSALQDEAGMDCICHQAKSLAQAGRYDDALGLLVSPSTFSTISFSEYTIWHGTIADVLRLRATRRQDEAGLQLLAQSFPSRDLDISGLDVEDAVDTPDALVELALRYLESGKSSSAERSFGLRFQVFGKHTAEEAAEALLAKAAQRTQSSQPMLSLMPTLAALSIAKDMDHSRLILAARVQLAETLGIHLKMQDGVRLLMESDLPNCLANNDAELRARAQWTYARLLLSCSDKQDSQDLIRVLHWLQEAEQECLELQTQILYYMLRLHHHLDNKQEVDRVSARLEQFERSWTRSDESQDQVYLEQVRQILDIVVSVAGYVASGEAASERLASA